MAEKQDGGDLLLAFLTSALPPGGAEMSWIVSEWPCVESGQSIVDDYVSKWSELNKPFRCWYLAHNTTVRLPEVSVLSNQCSPGYVREHLGHSRLFKSIKFCGPSTEFYSQIDTINVKHPWTLQFKTCIILYWRRDYNLQGIWRFRSCGNILSEWLEVLFLSA